LRDRSWRWFVVGRGLLSGVGDGDGGAVGFQERLHVAGDVPERQIHGLYVGFIYSSRGFPQGEQKHHKAEYHDDSDDCLHI
jgi:hypothetical protein